MYLLLAAGCATTVFSLLFCLHIQRSLTLEVFHYIPLSTVAIVVIVVEVMSAIAAHVLHISAADGDLVAKMHEAWKTYYSNEATSAGCVDGLQVNNAFLYTALVVHFLFPFEMNEFVVWLFCLFFLYKGV